MLSWEQVRCILCLAKEVGIKLAIKEGALAAGSMFLSNTCSWICVHSSLRESAFWILNEIANSFAGGRDTPFNTSDL